VYETFQSFYDKIVELNDAAAARPDDPVCSLGRLYAYIDSLGIVGRAWVRLLIWFHTSGDLYQHLISLFDMYYTLRGIARAHQPD
jgi:hypothetical protein